MKLKKLLSLLASLAMTVTAITGAMTASASEVANGTCGEGITWTLDSDGKLTISGEGEMASPEVENSTAMGNNDETVASQLGDYPDIYTYKVHKDDIKEVVIEEGVTAIGFCAFYQFSNLETVVLPKTITEFKGVGLITTTTEPSAGGRVDCYASYAFAECTSLKNLTLPDGMEALGGYAFYGCTSLESVRIPSTIYYEVGSVDGTGDNSSFQYWGIYTFAKCSSLKNITLPEGLLMIGAYAFAETAVESIVIPSTVCVWHTYRGGKDGINDAFSNTKLSSITFTDGIKRIARSPILNCPKLTRLYIPKSVTNIRNAFQYCTGLQEVYIEEGVKMQGMSDDETYGFRNVFTDCTNLKKLEIPEGVEIAYTNARWCYGCSSLQDIYLHGKEYMSARVNALNEISMFHCYPDSTLYKSSSVSDERKANLEEDLSKAKDTLNTKLKDAKALNENDYTAESYAALKTAIDNAEKFDESYTGVLPIEWAAEDISNAINSLVKKPAQDSVKPGTTKPSTTTPNVKSQSQKNAENAMKQAKITKLTVKSKAKKKITVTWKKVSKANGYQVQVSTNKKFKKSKIILTKTTSKKKITIKKLKSKKTYFVRVRAYATYKDSNGKPQKVYSSWIKKTRKVKVK